VSTRRAVGGRPWLVVKLVLLGLVLAALPALPARGAASESTQAGALTGTVEEGSLLVVAGLRGRRDWLPSEKAAELARTGDPVSLYELRAGPIGKAQVAGTGKLGQDTSPVNWTMLGAWYPLCLDPKLVEPFASASAGSPRTVVGLWHSPAAPAPRWVEASVLDPWNRTYRNIISKWLAARGVSEEVRHTITVEQIVRADINGDGRTEVFLSFHTPITSYPSGKRSNATSFSYLLMRYLPRHSRRASAVVVEDMRDVVHNVVGLCDLDGDGWAEVITESYGIDAIGTSLHSWTGRGFRAVSGWGGGV
jgi:hypothetical protein